MIPASAVGSSRSFLLENDVKLGILEGSAVYYSRRFVAAMHRDPGETGIPIGRLGPILKGPPENSPTRRRHPPVFKNRWFYDASRRTCVELNRVLWMLNPASGIAGRAGGA